MKEKKMLAAVAGVCLILLQAACGGNAGSPSAPAAPTAPSPAALGPIDPALVGTGKGTVNGDLGLGQLTMNLMADGTAWFEGTGRYCRADGNWGVSGTQFTARGGDCTGTVITKVAPVSSTNLTGTWSASSGRMGTFSVTRQ